MWVDNGRLNMLEAQRSYIQTLQWGLYTNNFAETETAVFSDLVEASWTGYARVSITSTTAPVLISGRASTTPGPIPVFSNSSGAPVTFFGWFLIDPSGNVLLFMSYKGSQTIPDTGQYFIGPSITDTQE